MTLIVQQGTAGPAADRAIRAMFEDRKSVFVDLLKWDLPVLDGRFELDAFDNEHATY
jgi:acyl-homoserine lactone synthase